MIKSYEATLSHKTLLAPNLYLLKIQLKPGEIFNFNPGQFVLIDIPHEGKVLKRAYSIASASGTTDSFELLIKVVMGGTASTYFTDLAAGAALKFSGPSGVFTVKNTPLKKVFLTTGSGIAPVRSFFLSQLHTMPKPVYLFWGVAHVADACLIDELETLRTQEPGFDYHVCVSRESNFCQVGTNARPHFFCGHMDECAIATIKALAPDKDLPTALADYEFYLCGQRDVVESTHQHLLVLGAPPANIVFEKY